MRKKENRLPGRLRACSLLMSNEAAQLLTEAADRIDAAEEYIRELEEDLQRLTVDPCLFDQEEVYENCTVQVLKNSHTGDISIGFWPPDQGQV